MNGEGAQVCLRLLLSPAARVEAQVVMLVMPDRVHGTGRGAAREMATEASLKGCSVLKTLVIVQLANGIVEMEKVFCRKAP